MQKVELEQGSPSSYLSPQLFLKDFFLKFSSSITLSHLILRTAAAAASFTDAETESLERLRSGSWRWRSLFGLGTLLKGSGSHCYPRLLLLLRKEGLARQAGVVQHVGESHLDFRPRSRRCFARCLWTQIVISDTPVEGPALHVLAVLPQAAH